MRGKELSSAQCRAIALHVIPCSLLHRLIFYFLFFLPVWQQCGWSWTIKFCETIAKNLILISNFFPFLFFLVLRIFLLVCTLKENVHLIISLLFFFFLKVHELFKMCWDLQILPFWYLDFFFFLLNSAGITSRVLSLKWNLNMSESDISARTAVITQIPYIPCPFLNWCFSILGSLKAHPCF